MNDQVLENVSVVVEPAEGFEIVVSVPCEKLEYNVLGTCYVALTLPEAVLACTGTALTFGYLSTCSFDVVIVIHRYLQRYT